MSEGQKIILIMAISIITILGHIAVDEYLSKKHYKKIRLIIRKYLRQEDELKEEKDYKKYNLENVQQENKKMYERAENILKMLKEVECRVKNEEC